MEFGAAATIWESSALVLPAEHVNESSVASAKSMDIIFIIHRYQDATAEDYAGHEADGKSAGWIIERDAFATLDDYTGDQPKYTGEWKGSFSDMIGKASWGALAAPRSQSKIVVADLQKKYANMDLCTGCKTVRGCQLEAEADAAVQAVRAQHRGVNPAEFTFRVHLFPSAMSTGALFRAKCYIDAVSDACVFPHQMPKPGSCLTHFFDSRPGLFAHELGHSFGLQHATGPELVADPDGGWATHPEGKLMYYEYGDLEAMMGATSVNAFTDYIAPNRHWMGMLQEPHLAQIFGDSPPAPPGTTYQLSSISMQTLAAADGAARTMAIRIGCPLCRPRGKIPDTKRRFWGGSIWLSFRGAQGYSALNMEPRHLRKVYVHLELARNTMSAISQANPIKHAGTEIWEALGPGESFTIPYSCTPPKKKQRRCRGNCPPVFDLNKVCTADELIVVRVLDIDASGTFVNLRIDVGVQSPSDAPGLPRLPPPVTWRGFEPVQSRCGTVDGHEPSDKKTRAIEMTAENCRARCAAEVGQIGMQFCYGYSIVSWNLDHTSATAYTAKLSSICYIHYEPVGTIMCSQVNYSPACDKSPYNEASDRQGASCYIKPKELWPEAEVSSPSFDE